jgi:hypothetical protein
MSDLYDADILLWSERQAGLLRGVAAERRVDADPVDWSNIIEEIESVGREQLHAVHGLLMRAMVHRLKIIAWPACSEVPHWQSEARLFEADAGRRYVPSMRRRIDLPSAYARARHALPTSVDGIAPGPVPDDCPWTLSELLGED